MLLIPFSLIPVVTSCIHEVEFLHLPREITIIIIILIIIIIIIIILLIIIIIISD